MSIFNTDEALAKASALIKEGNLAKAGLYFSNGLSQNPGNWEMIYRYQQQVLNYCCQLHNQGEYELIYQILADMEAFMRNQAFYVATSEIEQLDQALEEIEVYKQLVNYMAEAASRQVISELMKTRLVTSDELLACTPSDQDADEITQHIQNLTDNLASLQEVDTRSLEETALSKLNEKMKLLKQMIANFEQQLATAQTAAKVLTLVQRAEQMIEHAQYESAQSELILYYLTSAESIIRQLVLFAPDMAMATAQIATLSQHLEKAKQTISQRQSSLIWNEIEQTFAQLEIDEDSKAQEAIEQLTRFRQWLAEKVNKLSSQEFLDQVQALMEKVNNELAQWQGKQLRRYEQWAIQKIQEFYKRYKDELGLFADKKVIYTQTLNYLSPIDIRYLSMPASTAYNEAFNMFYAKLDKEQKIPFSAAMSLKPKKSLSDF